MRVSACLAHTRRETPNPSARPVTPEVAGSSPVAPVSNALLEGGFRLDTSTRGATTQRLWNVVGTSAHGAVPCRRRTPDGTRVTICAQLDHSGRASGGRDVEAVSAPRRGAPDPVAGACGRVLHRVVASRSRCRRPARRLILPRQPRGGHEQARQAPTGFRPAHTCAPARVGRAPGRVGLGRPSRPARASAKVP